MNHAFTQQSQSLQAGEPIPAGRARSQRTLTDILHVLGYPEDWATPLERNIYRSRSKVWRPADS